MVAMCRIFENASKLPLSANVVDGIKLMSSSYPLIRLPYCSQYDVETRNLSDFDVLGKEPSRTLECQITKCAFKTLRLTPTSYFGNCRWIQVECDVGRAKQRQCKDRD